jgi:hypothetical protein
MSLTFLNYSIFPKEKGQSKFDSSVIKSFIYHIFNKTLEVTFNSGKKYIYFDVELEEYKSFCCAKSKGKYFFKNIKNKKTVRTE